MSSLPHHKIRIPYARPLLLLCAIVFCIGFASPLLAAPPLPVLQKKDAVVSIIVKDRNQHAVKTVSGTVIDRDGLVATTCSAVISWLTETRSSFRVLTAEGNDMPVLDVLGCNRANNTAILRIPAEGLPMAAPAQKSASASSLWLAGRDGSNSRILPLPTKPQKKTKKKTKKQQRDSVQVVTTFPERLTGGAVLNDRGELVGIGTNSSSGAGTVVPWETIREQRDLYKKQARKNRMIDALLQGTPRQEVQMDPAPVIAAQKRADTEPANPAAWIELARACDAAHLPERAIAAWKRAAQLDPGSYEAALGLGIASYHAGRYREAISAYENALRLKPDSLSIQVKIGAAWLIMGEFRQAIEVLKKAVEIDPRSASAHFNLGVAHYLNGDKSSAMIEYLRLSPLDPALAQNLFDLMN
ncbi:MAG: serine protease [Nitrospiraceae bacterium]|jgi:tetratricopeptide (TPR) repeat protein|nr:serine protease [Nitrospiraceae bacterium]